MSLAMGKEIAVARTSKRITYPLAAVLFCVTALSALATDVHFDYTSFDNPNTPGVTPHFGQAQFDVLNYPSINGNYMMTSTDNHRPEMTANNNALAEFYNNFLADYNTQIRGTGLDAVAEADAINAYTVKNSTKNGARPNWLLLNELSASVWPDTTQKGIDYRAWCVGVVTRLHDTYGYDVVTFAPFATVGTGRAADWQLLTAKSYVGVENYLSGAEVMAGGTDYASRVAWAQAQYQASVTTYGAAGVPKSKLILTEEFANTTSGTGWGRAGLSASDWDTVIQIRQDAIYKIGFPGFAAYAWGSNGMLITEAEQIQHEYWYRTRLVLPGQQPQWLSDDAINVNGTIIPLSWSQQLNWIGGVPNSPGAIANFFRTNTAARTVTLDGARTIGVLSFNSPSSYTISPGSGGAITLNNNGAGANVTVPQGAHTIGVQIALADNATFNVTSALSLTGGISNSAGKTITKTGAGSINISGVQTHGNGAIFNANGGVTNFNSDGGANLTVNANATVNFNSAQNLKGLTIAATKIAKVAAGGSSTLRVGTFNIAGKLDLNDNPGIIDYSGASPLDTIRQLIKTGYNNGAWNGNGITSSLAQAAAGTSNMTAIGFAEASKLYSSFPATFAGQNIDNTTIVLRYTVPGDANMSGTTDILDFNLLATSFGKPGMTWRDGDFDYNGTVDISDFNLLASNFGKTAPPSLAQAPQALRLASNGSAAVPLPAPVYVGAAGLILAVVAARKYRKSNH
jgi:hypothetical protein